MANLSERLKRFKPSKIVEIASLATDLLEQGVDIADLSTGEPDFPTHEFICEKAIEAINNGVTKYTSVDGTSALKRAVQKKFTEENQLHYELDEIIVDSGAKPLLMHALTAIVDQGDEVIVATPCWPSHPGMIQLFEADPIYVEGSAANGFKITADALQSKLTDKTKAVILNSPANPSGAIYSHDELKAIADVLLNYPNIWIVADDIYEKLRYDGRAFATIAQVEPRLKERTITVNGMSKGFAMTGWRIGFAGGPVKLMQAMRQIMSQATGNPCSISQVAAIAGLTMDTSFIDEQIHCLQSRRDKVCAFINEAPGLDVNPCEGAFYLFVNCSGVIGKLTNDGKELASSTDFAEYLLKDYGVAVVPGAAFQYDPYFRLSFATSDEVLDKAGERIVNACRDLS